MRLCDGVMIRYVIMIRKEKMEGWRYEFEGLGRGMKGIIGAGAKKRRVI